MSKVKQLETRKNLKPDSRLKAELAKQTKLIPKKECRHLEDAGII